MIQSSLLGGQRMAHQHVRRHVVGRWKVTTTSTTCTTPTHHDNLHSYSLACTNFSTTTRTLVPTWDHGGIKHGSIVAVPLPSTSSSFSSVLKKKNRTLLFSTESFGSNTTSTTISEIPSPKADSTIFSDDMSSSQLIQACTEYCSQGSAREAQHILNLLQSPTRTTSDNDSITLLDDEGIDLTISVLNAWIQYQDQRLQSLDQLLVNNNNQNNNNNNNRKIILEHLEDICEAAESATQLWEQQRTSSTSASKDEDYHQLLLTVLKAWANASEAGRKANLPLSFTTVTQGIPQRMQHLLQPQATPSQKSKTDTTTTTTITTTTTSSSNTSTIVSTDAYNELLKAWACSGEHLRGTMAEQIFQGIKDPNGDTFRWIICAWCWSKERRCAFTATGHYMRRIRLLELGQIDMEPTMEDYHILFDAWTKAEDKNAPSKAYTVIQFMEDANRKGLTAIRPDERCYRDTLITMSRRLNVPELGELTDKTLASMKERAMVPDSSCYGAAILAWKNVATNRDCDDRDASAKRTLQLLREMTQAYYRTTTSLVKPTVENYNHVLEALGVVSMVTKATDDAEMLLRAMEEAADPEEHHGRMTKDLEGEERTGDLSSTVLRPNTDTYRLVLEIWRKSKSVDKVQRGRRVLQRMLNRMDDLWDQEGEDESSFVEVFNAFIRVCAKPLVKDEAEKMKTVKLALQTADEMRKLGMHPNAGTYSSLLEACHRLIPEGADRSRMLENVFRKCCDEGCVDQAVLEQFHSVASSYLYGKLVVGHGEEVEGIKVVPVSWTRNIAKQGRKVLPLSIDGQFKETIAAKEYKMRKLRRRSNQRFLQGGRMSQ